MVELEPHRHATINQPNGAPATIVGHPVTLPFQYQDGWFYSLGAEYHERAVTVRAGIAYEKTPITDQVRTPRHAGQRPHLVSVGATYKLTPKLSLRSRLFASSS